MNIGIVGMGAIGSYVRSKAVERGFNISAALIRPQSLEKYAPHVRGTHCVSKVSDLPDQLDLMIDCAGHSALQSYGADILRRGIDLTTVSLGALANAQLFEELKQAADEGNSKLHLASGAIGALDCLQAARIGRLHKVTYTGRKPPLSWKGSLADTRLDLTTVTQHAQTHFSGTARNAALEYPKNANVAAAVALAGVGFDRTQVELIADPLISENIHQLEVMGDFGSFSFEIRGNSLPDNPRSSALAAMSVVASLEQKLARVTF